MSRSAIFRFRLVIWNNIPNMNNNNNNNNQNPLMQVRDRLFQVMFIRFSLAYSKIFSQFVRSIIEYCLLVFALFSLFILAYVHVTFVHASMNCLDTIENEWPRDGILRIEVIHGFKEQDYSLQQSYEKEMELRQYQGYNIPRLENVWKDDVAPPPQAESHPVNNKQAIEDEPLLNTQEEFYHSRLDDLNSDNISSAWNQEEGKVNHSDAEATDNVPNEWTSLAETDGADVDSYWTDGIYIMEYSLEYGFLKLSLAARKQLKVPVKLLVLDPDVNQCFGNWYTRFLLEYFLGYDDVLLASLSSLASKEENKGYIRNVVTEHYFRFVNVMNHSSYILATGIMLFFTFSISTLLRYSHHQIFIFIIQVLRLIELRGTTTIPLASLLTVILALVGMEAIMSEFFSDPTTSFYVILIVWTADQYDSICCRTLISRRHWLRFFYLYHFAFYAYDYRFSGQYSELALFTSCCFIFHSMIFFFHRYELPAILRTASHQNNLHHHHHHHLNHHHHHHHHHHHNVSRRPSSVDPPPRPPTPETETSTGSEIEMNLLPERERNVNLLPPEEGNSTTEAAPTTVSASELQSSNLDNAACNSFKFDQGFQRSSQKRLADGALVLGDSSHTAAPGSIRDASSREEDCRVSDDKGLPFTSLQ